MSFVRWGGCDLSCEYLVDVDSLSFSCEQLFVLCDEVVPYSECLRFQLPVVVLSRVTLKAEREDRVALDWLAD